MGNDCKNIIDSEVFEKLATSGAAGLKAKK